MFKINSRKLFIIQILVLLAIFLFGFLESSIWLYGSMTAFIFDFVFTVIFLIQIIYGIVNKKSIVEILFFFIISVFILVGLFVFLNWLKEHLFDGLMSMG